jgi:hypothetical protein
VTHLTPAQHRTIVVVDVAGFTDPTRRLPDQLAVRQGMYEVLKIAFADSDVDFDSCEHEDRGDGALILVPPTVSKSTLAERLPDRLVAALRRYNSTRVLPSQFKLRVGLHSGDIRHDGHGWVGHAVNLAFRILEVPEAKAALATSDSVVALISSEHFYAEVIEQDPGTDPEAYRQIAVSIKTFTGNAWLRLLGAPMADRSTSGVDTHEHVLELIPSAELSSLRNWLTMCEIPELALIMSRAVGPAIPLPRRADLKNAWDAFSYLAEFNAGPDGIPPAALFLELLAHELGGDVGEMITSWLGGQLRRLRLGTALEKQRPSRLPVPDKPHLHLTIMLEPDAIDPSRCVLSFWRQDNPLVWPPTLGDVRETRIDEIEYLVDKVITEAEGVWSGHGMSAAVEFLLPRTLLHLPVQRWSKEHESGQPRLLRYDYRISLRSLERMRAKHWHRAWHVRWDSMLENPSADRLGYSGSAEFEEHPIDAVLIDPHWVGLVMGGTPSPQPAQPGAGPDELVSALRAGLPVLLWHPDVEPAALRELVDWLLDGGFMDLPARRKLANVPTAGPFNDSLIRDLVVLWDDPKRVIVLDQPFTPSSQ